MKWLLLLGIFTILSCCSKMDVLNFTIPKSGYQTYKDIAYGSDPRNHLDIYVPDSVKEKPAPVILFFYGGSWQEGSKDDYLFVAQALASKGYVVVIPDYRIYPANYFPDFMMDAARTLRFVHENIAHYQGDNQEIFVAGHSAGAYIAVMLAVNDAYIKAEQANSAWIKGVIGISGPYDFLPFRDDIKAIFSKEKDELTQPIHFVHKGLPPFLLATGTDDTIVLPRNTRNITKKLQENQVEVTKKEYEGVGHVGIILSLARGFRGKTSLLEEISQFVNSHTAKHNVSPE